MAEDAQRATREPHRFDGLKPGRNNGRDGNEGHLSVSMYWSASVWVVNHGEMLTFHGTAQTGTLASGYWVVLIFGLQHGGWSSVLMGGRAHRSCRTVDRQ